MLIGYAHESAEFNTRYFLALLTTGMVWGVLTGHAQVVSQAAPLEILTPD